MGLQVALTGKDKALKDKWYAKLKKEGFNDIESDEDNLKRWDHMYFVARHTNFETKSNPKLGGASTSTWSGLAFTSRQEYFQLAGVFLYEHQFETETDRLVWELHYSGETAVGVYRALKKKNKKIGLGSVQKVIKRLSEVMVSQCLPKKI